MILLNKIRGAAELFFSHGPESRVSKLWLFKTSGRADKRFLATKPEHYEDDEFQYVRAKGKVYVWPKNASGGIMMLILSELLEASHPHHYEWGPTIIKPGDHVLDIGSCEGAFAAHAIELGATVTAIEPSRLNIQIIKKLFELRGLPEPLIAQCLIGSEISVAHFEDDASNPGGSRISLAPTEKSYPVSMLPLDEFVARQGLARVDFIKCDAEGADNAIIKSGIGVLKKFRPKLAITTYHNEGDYRELHDFLVGIGYSVTGKGFTCSNPSNKPRVIMLHGV